MEKIFHLSFLMYKDGDDRIDLESSNSLKDLDKYIIKNFKNNKEVRKKYEQDICEFVIDRIDFIKRENARNKRKWFGSICIICEEEDGTKYKIPIIYQNDKKLLSKDECLNKIKTMLKSNDVIKEIIKRKKYLLSNYEIDLFYESQDLNILKYKNNFINTFYSRIKNYADETLYYYSRCLMNIFKLNERSIITKFGTINLLNENIPSNITLKKDFNNDENNYLINLVDSKNYEELYNVYSIDEIDLYTDLKRGKVK